MLYQLLKAFILGIVASAPLGPVAMVVLGKTLNFGSKSGFSTGLGSALGDTIFATVALLAYSIADKFISDNKVVVFLFCGIVIIFFGFKMVFRNPFVSMKKPALLKDKASVTFFGQGLLTDLSSPGALMVMLALFTSFKIKFVHGDWTSFLIIPCVYLGAASYWYVFTAIFGHLRKTLNCNTLLWINRIAGAIVVAVGVSLLIKGFM